MNAGSRLEHAFFSRRITFLSYTLAASQLAACVWWHETACHETHAGSCEAPTVARQSFLDQNLSLTWKFSVLKKLLTSQLRKSTRNWCTYCEEEGCSWRKYQLTS